MKQEMSPREKCKFVVEKMRELGFDVIEVIEVDSWDDDMISYFIANYEYYYFMKSTPKTERR